MGASKQSKIRNELMTAMMESQTAGLNAINAKIASMTVGPTAVPSSQVSVGSTITSKPHVMFESHKVLAERAQVALVRLQLILKPPSKKDKKKNCWQQSNLLVVNSLVANLLVVLATRLATR